MHKYAVTLTTKDGHRVTDEISATSSNDANSVMRSRYPGCTIWSTKKVS